MLLNNKKGDFMEQNELYHYGVLGMKWGVRRAAKKGTTYTYKSHATKKYSKKADEYNNYANDYDPKNYTSKLSNKQRAKLQQKSDHNRAKARQYEQRAKRSAELDRKEQKIAENTKTGKVIATRMLTMGVGAKSYQRFQALGDSKKKAFVKSYVDTMLLGGYGHMIAKAKYIRQDEK